VSGNQGDRFRKRDREYARSMGRDASDTFDAEMLPGGKRRQLQLPPCDTCNGVGVQNLPMQYDKDINCPDCHGTGIAESGTF
jgi:DnaJ-class molecular chaperone